MSHVVIVDELGVSYADSKTFIKALQFILNLVCAAWKLPLLTFEWVANINGKDLVRDTDWLVYLTERNRKQGALGYHGVGAKGNLVAYCSINASPKLFGAYFKPFILRGKLINGARFRSGLVTVVAHELAEMLCDAKISTYSEFDPKVGGPWLVEVADPVSGGFLKYTDPDQPTVDCVLPDIVTPAFYQNKGVAPFSLAHTVSSPFTLAKPSGYAFFKNPKGALTPVPKS